VSRVRLPQSDPHRAEVTLTLIIWPKTRDGLGVKVAQGGLKLDPHEYSCSSLEFILEDDRRDSNRDILFDKLPLLEAC
jgi:hypothetical protein